MRALLDRWGYRSWSVYRVVTGAIVAWPAWDDLLPLAEKERRWPSWRMDCDVVAGAIERAGGFSAESRTTHVTPYVSIRCTADGSHCYWRAPMTQFDLATARATLYREKDERERMAMSSRYTVACTYVAALTQDVTDANRMPPSWRARVDEWVSVAFARMRYLHPEWTTAMIAAHVQTTVRNHQGLAAERSAIELDAAQQAAVLAPLPAWFVTGGYVESEAELGVWVK